MKRSILGFVSALALMGTCSVTLAQNPPPAPNNTAVNVRDRNSGAMTAGEQSNAKGDVDLTRRIRRAVMKDDALSTTAHNVKIVTANGAVTLRGPVNSQREKVAIGRKAQAIAGASNVDNELEVKNQ
ncbi:MAG TPA: BON domain-containing protein [Candidatus Binataceae bacterium]